MAGVSLQSPRAMPVRPSGGPTALLSAQHQGIQWGCQVQWQQEGSSQHPQGATGSGRGWRGGSHPLLPGLAVQESMGRSSVVWL